MAIEKTELYSSLWASCDEMAASKGGIEIRVEIIQCTKQELKVNKIWSVKPLEEANNECISF